MTSKHTPGPWGLNKAIDVWVMAGLVHVATIPRAYDGDWSPANARLIAAAPDMLAAIDDAIRTLEWAADKFEAEGMDGSMGIAILRVGALREVAAKARGEA